MEPVPFLDRFKWVILIVVGAIVLAVFGYLLLDKAEPVEIVIQPPLPTGTHTPEPTITLTPTLAPLEVYITGAVANPESRLSLPAGSRVEDAIEASGGTTDEADLSRVNLAQRLQDGDQIHVPLLGQADVNPTPTRNAPRLIDLNTATLEELETLPGIGPSTAQDIVDYRNENGFFRSVEELDEVPGIGEATLADILPLVMVDPSVLPEITATPAPTETAVPEITPTESGLINLNTATQTQLETLPGIGPSTAENIIEYREANGAFSSIDDLDNVPGIGAATIAEIRDLVTVE